MFNLLKPKLTTAFVSGQFYKDDEDPYNFHETALIGKGGDYMTAKDFIQAVREMHRNAGYATKFTIVKF